MGHSTVARFTSDQNFSLVLRPECVPVFKDLHEVSYCDAEGLDHLQLTGLRSV